MHNFPIELLTLIDVRANKQTVYHPFLTKTQNRMQITGVCSKPKYDLRGWKKGANNFHASIIPYTSVIIPFFFFFLSPKIRNPLILSPRSMYLNRRYIGSFFSTFSTIPISTTPNFLHFALLSSNVSWEQEEEILIYRKKESKENNKGSTIPILQLSFRRKSTIYRAALNEARETSIRGISWKRR